MSTVWCWIKKHWLKTLLIALGIILALVVPPLIVHAMYKAVARNPYFESTWSSGEMITYIAGFETFIGTVFLGFVAVRQNDKANKLNERMLSNEEKHRKYERQPCIQVTPREVITQTIHDIFNFYGPVYFYKDVKDLKGYPSRYWKKEFVFFSWSIANVTSKQIRVSYQKLEIEFLESQEKLSFSDHRLNLFSPIPVIVPQDSIGFGFIMETRKLRVKRMKLGTLVLRITNEVNENYSYTLGFSISPNNDNGFFIYNLYERVEPVE